MPMGGLRAVALALCLGGGVAACSTTEPAQPTKFDTIKKLSKHCRVYGPLSAKPLRLLPPDKMKCRAYGPVALGGGGLGVGIGKAWTCEKEGVSKDGPLHLASTAVCDLNP